MIYLLRLTCLCPVAAWSLQTSAQKAHGSRKSVWILAGERTGSSTMLSMMSATPDDNRAGGNVFSIYEPCHEKDMYNYRLDGFPQKSYPWVWEKTNQRVCPYIIQDLVRCDFSKATYLTTWDNPHNSNGYPDS